MSDLDQWIKLVAAVGAALGLGYKIITSLAKRYPPRATGLAAELSSLKKDVVDLKNDMRTLTDYVHDLREDYARDTGRAPRDWPEGLRL